MACPDDTFWTHLDFDIGVGDGGAMKTDSGTVTLDGVVFRGNAAPVGSSLSSVRTRELKITNTTFDDAEKAFAGVGVSVSKSVRAVADSTI